MIAAAENITLGEDHWKVMRYLRDEYREHGHAQLPQHAQGAGGHPAGLRQQIALRPLPGRPGQAGVQGRRPAAAAGQGRILSLHGHAPAPQGPLVQARAGREPGADRQRDRFIAWRVGSHVISACARRLRHRRRPGLLRRAARAAGLPARRRRPHRLMRGWWRGRTPFTRALVLPRRRDPRRERIRPARRLPTGASAPTLRRTVQPARSHYAEFGWSEAEALTSPFVRYLSHRLEPLLPGKDRRWVLDQVMAVEVPGSGHAAALHGRRVLQQMGRGVRRESMSRVSMRPRSTPGLRGRQRRRSRSCVFGNQPFDLDDERRLPRLARAKLADAPLSAPRWWSTCATRSRSASTAPRAAATARASTWRSTAPRGGGSVAAAPRRQLGLARLDANWLADETASRRSPCDRRRRRPGDFIFIPTPTAPSGGTPTATTTGRTPHPRHDPALRAAGRAGGANRLLDHEARLDRAAIWPRFTSRRSMRRCDETIPARTDDAGVRARRAGRAGVLSTPRAGCTCHTARAQHRVEDDAADAGRGDRRCAAMLAGDTSPFVLQDPARSRHGPGGNNVLHDRRAFTTIPAAPRLLYRARFSTASLPGRPRVAVVTVWRAAHLVGVSRGVLQRACAAASCPSATGWCPPKALLRCTRRRSSRKGAMRTGRGDQDRPSAARSRAPAANQEVLAQRLSDQSQELADAPPPAALPRAACWPCATRRASNRRRARRRRPAAAGESSGDDGLARVLATEPVDRWTSWTTCSRSISAQVTVRRAATSSSWRPRTLLQAGLRAGLKLNYGCGNGSCGMCRCA